MSSDVPPMARERADRKRNRDLIVRVARDAFARADEAGEAVSMNEIARAANVGPATLYRHFATRDELADAVYQSKIDDVTVRVLEATRDEDALTRLRAWVSEFVTFMLATRGMMDTLRAAWQSATAATSPTAAKITGILEGFVTAGEADGSIRADVDPADLTIAVLALLSATPPGDSGARSMRLLRLVMDGLEDASVNT
ncbi:transcriptional regulator, TetR family [Herbiconiux ginsengi]|uniref:Transcriptional regulator, TetR family n=2 Tax=Herbiconiux ginsengi TaxID=381665 RepID=A0A1H3L1G3_9MICO|nr:transcriptional regulator, TetR family [Herbiconiux ginsengi]